LFTIDLMLPAGLIAGSSDIEHARTAGFTVLVIAQLFNAFNSRSDRESAFRGLFHNPILFGAIGLSLLLQVLVVELPLLNEAFGTVPLSLGEWLTCALIASSVLWVDELRKVLSGRGRRERPGTSGGPRPA